MTAEITKSVLLPNTLPFPPRPSSISTLLVALLQGKGSTSTSLCHAKVVFWIQSVEIVGIAPFFTVRGLLDAKGGSRQALEALEREQQTYSQQ